MSTARSTIRSAALAATALLVLAGCSNGDDAADGGTDDATAAEVDARDISFDPAEITVSVGSEVTFTNRDSVPHTVTAGTPDDPGDAFDEAIRDEGSTATITFDEPGEVAYYCTIHPSMTGTVIVEG